MTLLLRVSLILLLLSVLLIFPIPEAWSGQKISASDFFEDLSAAGKARDARLEALLDISAQQQVVWRSYTEARRKYETAMTLQRRRELLEISTEAPVYDTTLRKAANALDNIKLELRRSHNLFYITLTDAQKAVADRELTPTECGK